MNPIDPATIAAIVTASGAAIGGIIGAVALLRRASTPTSLAKQILRRLHDWLDEKGLLDQLPPRLRADLESALDIKHVETKDEAL